MSLVILYCFGGFGTRHLWFDVYKESPESLKFPPLAKKSDTVIENIPTVADFEDTNFIGRKKEIGEIKEKLNKNNVHILSIIGDGGIGKTAIAIKVLYDLLDDPKCKYELILWTSLKTNELNNYEFKEIKNAISTTSEMYSKLGEFVGNNNSDKAEDYLISLAQQFKMLLVLDNLETINTEEIKDFLDKFTESGKVLITSRIGLGEMEHRYKLGGMSEDDVLEYMNTLLELYGFDSLLTESKKKEICISQLHSNPLAIKWFVRCLYNGDDIDAILKNKSELASFCMSNVFEKLSKIAHSILDVLIIVGREISVAELIYYMGKGIDEYKDISYAINELAKCNFIDDSIFKIKGKLSVSLFAKEYLTLSQVTDDLAIRIIKDKEQKLQAFVQKQAQNQIISPYVMKSFLISNERKDEMVVAYWLFEAIELYESKNETGSAAKLELARKILPDYFECYKVAAYLCSKTSIEKAKEEYKIAEICCREEFKEKMYICLAGLLLRFNDYIGSLEKLAVAAKYSSTSNNYILLEQAKIYACISNFEKAYEVLQLIDINSLSQNDNNKYLTRLADIKRREAEYCRRDDIKKFNLYKEAFSLLDKATNPDTMLFKLMCKLLMDLSYMSYYEEADALIERMLSKYYYNISSTSEYKAFREKMQSRLHHISNETLKNSIQRYLIDLSDIMDQLDTNEGVVYRIDRERKYGFFKNKDNTDGVYFKLYSGSTVIQIGDIVKYDCIIKTMDGKKVITIVSSRSLFANY